VRIGFDERDERVLPDMGVKVAFVAAESAGEVSRAAIMTVPKQALRRDGEQDVVLVVKDEKVERRAVKVGGADGTRAQITSGLAAGELVVIVGPTELADGDSVRIKENKGA
jgi:hypothetical protein